EDGIGDWSVTGVQTCALPILPMQPGFSEVLLGEVEMTDALQPTTLDGLWLMAAGQWDREVLQALARDGLEGIFEKLQEEFDFLRSEERRVGKGGGGRAAEGTE